MTSGYKVGQKFARDGKTMKIISVNNDGTATYSEYDHKTGKLKKGFQGSLPAITQHTIGTTNMLYMGGAEISAEEQEEKTYEAVAKLDQLPPEKTWRAGGLIQTPAILSSIYEWESSGGESTEAKKEFIFKLVGLVKLVEYVQQRNKETKTSTPYSEKTLTLLEQVKTDIIDGKIKLSEASKIYPEEDYSKGEKVLEAKSVLEFIDSLKQDLLKSKSSVKAYKKYLKQVQT